MAEVIIMPKLGFNMDEGELVKWYKSEGDTVSKGEVLFDINTDKTTMPVEATTDGIVLKLLANEGDFTPVFTPIAIVGQNGENCNDILKAYSEANGIETPDIEEAPAIEASAEIAEVVVSAKDLRLSPRARKYIKENEIDLASVKDIKGTGFEGGITEKDIKASPLARKLSEKTGVKLSNVVGTGINGKIMKEDVEKAIVSDEVVNINDKKILKTVPYKGVRKLIGDKLSQSKFTSPHLYFTDEIDTTKLTEFRAELNAASEVKISATDVMVLAASKALRKYPMVNSSLVDGNIVIYKSINIGVAVASDSGLVVPVVKDAQEKSITEIAVATKDLVSKARDGKLIQSEYSGGTFSISNLGMFGIGNFTAIINPPEAAILSISATKKKAVVITNSNGEDEIVARPIMNIQLSVDHRLIDGLLAAQFVEYMKEILENPIKILM